MPKHDALTPKAIANKIKAKGLQKLRWYCQMCQKQCRDENGFKCHTTSESHQRQLLLFAENPHRYLDSFSQEFSDGFLELLKRRFGTRRVHANQVYQEYIADRHHLHMNATKWETLTQYVKWLGRQGKCTVDHTEKGWFITYIDRDPDTIRRQEKLAKKERMDKDDEEKIADFVNQQVERAKKEGKQETEMEYTEFRREDEDEKISVTISSTKAVENKMQILPKVNPFSEFEEKSFKKTSKDKPEKRKRDTLAEIIEEQEKIKEKRNRKDNWITEGIVVKIITKSLGDAYYNKKGVIVDVQNTYAAIVKVINGDVKVKLDQVHLETVIPNQGRLVKVVNGAYRGYEAVLMDIDEKKFCCTIKIKSGPAKDRIIEKVQYEDISKLHIS